MGKTAHGKSTSSRPPGMVAKITQGDALITSVKANIHGNREERRVAQQLGVTASNPGGKVSTGRGTKRTNQKSRKTKKTKQPKRTKKSRRK